MYINPTMFKAVFCAGSYIQVSVGVGLELVPTGKKVLESPVLIWQHHSILGLMSVLYR